MPANAARKQPLCVDNVRAASWGLVTPRSLTLLALVRREADPPTDVDEVWTGSNHVVEKFQYEEDGSASYQIDRWQGKAGIRRELVEATLLKELPTTELVRTDLGEAILQSQLDRLLALIPVYRGKWQSPGPAAPASASPNLSLRLTDAFWDGLVYRPFQAKLILVRLVPEFPIAELEMLSLVEKTPGLTQHRLHTEMETLLLREVKGSTISASLHALQNKNYVEVGSAGEYLSTESGKLALAYCRSFVVALRQQARPAP